MDRIVARYRVTCPADQVEARARALAIEQSIEMPPEGVTDPAILSDIVAEVRGIEPEGGAFRVTLGIAAATTGPETSQLMNMVFGNCSLMPEVELVDLEFPEGYARGFAGPSFGVDGVRAVTGAKGRALTCSALKPQGSPVEHLAALARTFALAGVDIVKDDHGIANQAYSPFERRVPAVQKAILEANQSSGGRTVYAPTFSGTPSALREQARIAKDCGVKMALVAPMLVGLPSFVELQAELALPVMAHPSMAGAGRMAPPLLLGKLFRLFGADMTIFPNYAGRFSYSRDACLAITEAARRPWPGVRPAMPVPAGGMIVERVDEMLGDYGIDTVLLIGGNLLIAREHLLERSRAFVEAVARWRPR